MVESTLMGEVQRDVWNVLGLARWPRRSRSGHNREVQNVSKISYTMYVLKNICDE